MSRRKTKNRLPKNQLAAAGAARPAAPAPAWVQQVPVHIAQKAEILNMSGYDAANPSQTRGYVYWPTLDSRKVMGAGSRRIMIKKSRAITENTGIGRRVTKGLSTLVGNQTPQARSSSPEFNKALEARFRELAFRPAAFDRSAKLDWYSWQSATRYLRFRDADCYSLKTTNAYDGALRIALYEAHQCGDGSDPQGPPPDMIDGIRVDSGQRFLSFRFVDPADPTSFQDIAARQVIHHVDHESSQSIHGRMITAHALNHMQDIGEIFREVKHGIKVAQDAILVRTRLTAQTSEAAKRGFNGGPVAATPFPGQAAASTPGSGENVAAPVAARLEDAYESGAVFDNMQVGEDIKLLNDSRPHPNMMNFVDALVVDIFRGAGVSAAVGWQMDGNSANVRYEMSELSKWIADQQSIDARSLREWWVTFASLEIKNGRTPNPPADWYEVDFIPEADPTIDESKLGKLELDRINAGLETYTGSYGRRGKDAEDQVRTRAREDVRFKQICIEEGTTWEEICKPRQGSAAPVPFDATAPA